MQPGNKTLPAEIGVRGRFEKDDGWRAWQDSNPQPLGPKPSALSIELQAQKGLGGWGERRDSNP